MERHGGAFRGHSGLRAAGSRWSEVCDRENPSFSVSRARSSRRDECASGILDVEGGRRADGPLWQDRALSLRHGGLPLDVMPLNCRVSGSDARDELGWQTGSCLGVAETERQVVEFSQRAQSRPKKAKLGLYLGIAGVVGFFWGIANPRQAPGVEGLATPGLR